ncbi:MAG: class I SAM-dependent methyltransferase [Anaerolineaceae bacterium]|nr:class I SAM-dependent methyltransferase [Anaerolineaceae bacterium]
MTELYGSLAFGYDIVANIVSLGDWNQWTYQIKKFLSHEEKILEVGIGTGILHKNLIKEKYQIFGCDLSKQMLKISSRRLKDYSPKILRTNNRKLPFRDNSFTKIIATFPSDYIFTNDFQKESQRLLTCGGELIVLLSINFVKNDFTSRFYRILYKITGQSLSKSDSERIIRDLFGSYMVVNLVWEPYKNVELCFVTLKSK